MELDGDKKWYETQDYKLMQFKKINKHKQTNFQQTKHIYGTVTQQLNINAKNATLRFIKFYFIFQEVFG